MIRTHVRSEIILSNRFPESRFSNVTLASPKSKTLRGPSRDKNICWLDVA
jgi:hypothetical protein